MFLTDEWNDGRSFGLPTIGPRGRDVLVQRVRLGAVPEPGKPTKRLKLPKELAPSEGEDLLQLLRRV